MAKPSSKTSLDLLPEYLKFKHKIVNGEITKAEVRELYEAFGALDRTEQSKALNNCLGDLSKTINLENLHKFVGMALEVEADVLNASTRDQSTKRADFIRNVSLAKNALVLECQKLGFGKEVYNVLKGGNNNKVIEALVKVKIPEPIREHYSKIIEPFYEKNGNAKEAATNLVFHGLSTTIAKYATEEGRASIMSPYNKLVQATYSKHNEKSYDVIYKSITGEVASKKEIDTLIKGAKTRFKDKEKQIKAELSQEKVSWGQGIRSFVTSVFSGIGKMLSRDNAKSSKATSHSKSGVTQSQGAKPEVVKPKSSTPLAKDRGKLKPTVTPAKSNDSSKSHKR